MSNPTPSPDGYKPAKAISKGIGKLILGLVVLAMLVATIIWYLLHMF